MRVREIKLYNLGFNECGYKEVLADLKGIIRYNGDIKSAQKNTTTELHCKFQKYVKFFRKFFKGIKPIEDDLDSVKATSFIKDNEAKGNWFMTSLIPIGKIDDYKNEAGEELV